MICPVERSLRRHRRITYRAKWKDTPRTAPTLVKLDVYAHSTWSSRNINDASHWRACTRKLKRVYNRCALSNAVDQSETRCYKMTCPFFHSRRKQIFFMRSFFLWTHSCVSFLPTILFHFYISAKKNVSSESLSG